MAESSLSLFPAAAYHAAVPQGTPGHLGSLAPEDAWWARAETRIASALPECHLHLLMRVPGRRTGFQLGRPCYFVDFVVYPHLPLFTGKLVASDPLAVGRRLACSWSDYLRLTKLRARLAKQGIPAETLARWALIEWVDSALTLVPDAAALAEADDEAPS